MYVYVIQDMLLLYVCMYVRMCCVTGLCVFVLSLQHISAHVLER